MGSYNEGFQWAVLMGGSMGSYNEGFQWAVIMRGFKGQL